MPQLQGECKEKINLFCRAANENDTRLFLPRIIPEGYIPGMKTAVSIPKNLFEEAENLARSTHRSRSRLFADALREYLARHAPDKVTEAMNQALLEIGAGKDEFIASVARHRLERTEW